LPRVADSLCFQQFCYLGNGIFWVGSISGVFVYDGHHNTISRIDEIPAEYSLNIAKLSTGSVLVTFYPADYYYFYFQQKLYKIPTGDHPELREIVSVREDGRGRVWFATNSGLSVASREGIEAFCQGKEKSVYYYKYTSSEGLNQIEFNGGLNPSSAISGDGYLGFNSMAGVFLFHQDSVRPTFPAGGIQLYSLGRSGGAVQVGSHLSLEHDNEGKVLQASVPYYADRANLLLQYKMDDAPGAWTDIGADGRIAIPPMSHGGHTLSLRTRTGLGSRDYLTKAVNIHVSELFFETPVFRILAGIVLFAICLFFGILIVRLRKEIRLKNDRLLEKNFLLEEALDELKETITLKEKLIALILHDLKTPLYYQHVLLDQLNAADHFTSDDARRLFGDLKTSSASVVKLTKDFLTWYSSQKDGFTVKRTRFEYEEVVRELFSVYSDIAGRKRITMRCKCGGPEWLYTDKDLLEIILRNLLDNAIKYTTDGSITIALERKEDGCAIVVSDTGRGMTADKIKQLEDYAQQPHHQSSETFGYRFIFSLAEKIGAGIRISSEPRKGTNVTIFIPGLNEARLLA
ncbi:MAG TPA: HAMP domain-containing sensor histidine kinase, partial [Puia sp.]|nr:HAMP domain-containing sensor histidine kinase [Puia sp.]